TVAAAVQLSRSEKSACLGPPGRGVRTLFFFNDTATTEIYTLSLHDALPILGPAACSSVRSLMTPLLTPSCWVRSEEHTSELQSQFHLVCRLLLEKKKST